MQPEKLLNNSLEFSVWSLEKGETIMKDTKILVIANCLLVIGLLWTLGVAQASAVDYQTKYKGTMYNVQSTASYGAAAPAATFQSTSALAPRSWAEESATPMLNADGSVDGSAYMGGASNAPAGPRRAGPVGPGTPGGDLNKDDQQPLGDVLLPLTLLACAYAIYKVSRRRKEA